MAQGHNKFNLLFINLSSSAPEKNEINDKSNIFFINAGQWSMLLAIDFALLPHMCMEWKAYSHTMPQIQQHLALL